MVQLSSRYDSELHKKVFILKGDEAYARTTDVVASLITDFNDYTTHIDHFHIGLEIEVLRELGKSTLYIYNNDEMLFAIPYNDSNMDVIIDEDWNEQGVYWINNKLVIGMKDDEHDINTGLFLPYDVENKIRVEYIGNKHCLGSAIKPISLLVETPSSFHSTLTFSSEDTRYLPNSTVDDIELLFECENTISEPKSVRLYDGNTLIDTLSMEKDVPVTLDLGVLSDGLHTLKAVFDGDNEAFSSDKEYGISVGYKINNLEYTDPLMNGTTGNLSCKVTDYFDEPWSGLQVKVAEYDTIWSDISISSATGDDGLVSVSNVEFSSNPFAVTIGSWHDVQHTVNVITVTSLNNQILGVFKDESSYNGIGVYVMPLSNNQQIPIDGIPITLTATDGNGLTETLHNKTSSSSGRGNIANFGLDTNRAFKGKVTIVSSVDDTQVTETSYVNLYQYYWSVVDDMNPSYSTGYRLTHVSLTKLNNGFKIDGAYGGVVSFPISSTNDYEIDFDCRSSVEKTGDHSFLIGERSFGEIPVNAHIKIKFKKNGDREYYMNDRLIASDSGHIMESFRFVLSNHTLVIDNLKVLRTG